MAVDQNYIRLIAYGIALVLILYARPEGIIVEKPTLTMSRSKLKGLLKPGKGSITNMGELDGARMTAGQDLHDSDAAHMGIAPDGLLRVSFGFLKGRIKSAAQKLLKPHLQS